MTSGESRGNGTRKDRWPDAGLSSLPVALGDSAEVRTGVCDFFGKMAVVCEGQWAFVSPERDGTGCVEAPSDGAISPIATVVARKPSEKTRDSRYQSVPGASTMMIRLGTGDGLPRMLRCVEEGFVEPHLAHEIQRWQA